MCKFEEHELNMISSNSFLREKREWSDIQEQKRLLQEYNQPYMEEVQTFDIKFNKKEGLRLREKHKKEINENLKYFVKSKGEQ